MHRLINDQTLPSVLAKMPPNDWRQWAKERPTWMREAIKEAFWSFVDQKWRDALNVAAAEPAGLGSGGSKGATHEHDKRGQQRQPGNLRRLQYTWQPRRGSPSSKARAADGAHSLTCWDAQVDTRLGNVGALGTYGLRRGRE